MNNQDIDKTIKECLFDAIGFELELDTELEELDLDSLEKMAFFYEIEDKFKIELLDEDISKLRLEDTSNNLICEVKKIVLKLLD